jgi:hypothetical protein
VYVGGGKCWWVRVVEVVVVVVMEVAVVVELWKW